MMYTYYVYILLCSDDTYYTGITNNLKRRFEEHRLGTKRNAYTYSRRPLDLKFYHQFDDVIQAIAFEKKIKGWTKAKKQALIDGNFNLIQILSECRNATHFKYAPNKENKTDS